VAFGQAQVLDNQVRLTGQILDVASGKSLGNLAQTGPISDLFKLEDGLAKQVIDALPDEFLNLRGLTSVHQTTAPPRIIQLPGDTQTPLLNNGPIDGGPSVVYGPSTSLSPGYPPPYSPNAGTYPWRFTSPYSHLFTYDYDPDPFLPVNGIAFPDRFSGRGHDAGAERHSERSPRQR
jgi:hypothetical protein